MLSSVFKNSGAILAQDLWQFFVFRARTTTAEHTQIGSKPARQEWRAIISSPVLQSRAFDIYPYPGLIVWKELPSCQSNRGLIFEEPF